MENKKAWNDKDVLNPKFLGSWDIPTDGTIIVKIIESKTEEVDNFKTNKKEQKLVVYIQNHKPMVCNITNAKAVSKALKSKYLEDWNNKYIEIGTKRIRAFGEDTDCLRVKDKAPTPPVVKKEVITKEHKNFEVIKQALLDKKTTVEKLNSMYEISEETWKLLR